MYTMDSFILQGGQWPFLSSASLESSTRNKEVCVSSKIPDAIKDRLGYQILNIVFKCLG